MALNEIRFSSVRRNSSESADQQWQSSAKKKNE